MRKLNSLKLLLSALLLTIGCNVWGANPTVTYTVKTTSSVTTTGTAPTGSSAVFTQDYTTAGQMTQAKPNASLTLSNFSGCRITNITANLRNSNSSKVAVTVKNGSTTVYTNSSITLSSSSANKTIFSDAFTVAGTDDITITFKASASSVYLSSVTITYEIALPYTVNYSRNGVVESNVSLNSPYTLPTKETEAGIGDWNFMGWSLTPVSETTSKPTLVSYATENNQTFYAVYGKTEGGIGTTYEIITELSEVVEGNYYIASNKVNSAKYHFANATASSGNAGVEETGVNVAESYDPTEIPSGAVLYEISGNNTDGFSLKELSTNKYLVATASKASLSYSDNCTESWVFTKKDGGFVLTGKLGSKMSSNSTTAASTIRNYASTGSYYDPLYFFIETESGITTYKSTITTSEDITISAAQYATYYNADHAFVMPEGLEGIVVDAIKDNTLDLTAYYAKGDVVPAGEPLILHATSTLAEATQFALVYGTTTDPSLKSTGDNLLSGTSTADEMTIGGAPYYRLTQHEGNVGFYYGAEKGAAFAPGANKAYLALNTSAGAPIRFIIEGTEVATDIENMNGETIDGEPKKVLINGQVFILRGEKLYTAQGQLVK